MAFVDEIKNSFRNSNALSIIITINLVFFIIINIAVNVSSKYTALTFLSNVTFPADINNWLQKPWTIITYMFSHAEFFHFLFNMMWLFTLGKILTNFSNERVLTNLYLFGGISGAILYAIIYSFSSDPINNNSLIGASAGVMAIVIGAAVIAPNLEMNLFGIFQIKLKYLALASFFLTSILDLAENTGGKVAHIGGAIYGLIFMMQYKKGRDWSIWMNGISKLFGRGSSLKVVHKRRLTDEDYNFDQKLKQKKVDEILDKISKSGYDSLTRQEKDFLLKASNKN